MTNLFTSHKMNPMSQEARSTNPLGKLTPILVIVSIGLAFFVGVLWQKVQILEKGGTNPQKTTAEAEEAPAQVKVSLSQIKDLFNKDLIKFGKGDEKLSFVEVSDPSCPYCHAASGKNPELNRQMDPSGRFKLTTDGGTYLAPVPEIKKLVDESQASFVYIYSPGHGNGEMGMKALYCAFENGKFWQVHDQLFTTPGYELLNNTVKNDKTKAKELATFLKGAIDSSFLTECLDSGKYDERLTSDISVSQSIGVSGTPGFFVNETAFAGAYSFTDMQPAVDAALK